MATRKTIAPAAVVATALPDPEQENAQAAVDALSDIGAKLLASQRVIASRMQKLHAANEAERQAHAETHRRHSEAAVQSDREHAADVAQLNLEHANVVALLKSELDATKDKLASHIEKLRKVGGIIS